MKFEPLLSNSGVVYYYQETHFDDMIVIIENDKIYYCDQIIPKESEWREAAIGTRELITHANHFTELFSYEY